jgi:PilZ domain
VFNENQFGMEHHWPELETVEPRGVERRRHARYAVDGDAEVLVADGSQIFRGGILDISLSGCFIETRARLRVAVGTPVEMVFRANGVMLRTAATVRAVRRGAGAGFVFEGLSARMQAELETLIEALEGSC